ncbi:DEK domain-containing chromatin-associated protein 4-like [Solanum verrucosum]|uniref:DEK domain-containing chromatin-associated protein 4-like n=1 Tax=Solanum verrucosum TaxID=315347 RepID=UPI0020D174A1|nr:DEK domain-containing chromatin-associated protein 4-like [Solanum verrucosum]
MGEDGDCVTELAEVSADNNVAAEDKSEAFIEKNAEKDELKEVEEESKEADERDIENMDIDEEEVKESKGGEEKEETKFEVMEEETAEIPDNDKEMVEDVANVQKEKIESTEDHAIEKGSKESDKSKSRAQKKDRKRKRKVEDKKELKPKTPLAPTIVRPVRQRKSVERLVASIEGELTKEIYIEKGRGTALQDIPNVAYKLSKRKTDDTLKLLHNILFGRRGKAAQFKSNISLFSGLVWHENEEKQKMKVKEKLDKCVKEKLLELCDVLDIPVDEDTSRKEDLESQLMDFLDAPHPMTSELLAEKEQSSKGKKKKSPSSTIGSLEGSTKSHKKKKAHEPKDDQERSDDEMSKQTKSEEKDGKSEEGSEKDKKKHKRSSNKSSKKESTGEVKTKKTPSNSSKSSKNNDNNDANPKVHSKKKTTEVVKGNPSTPKKPSSSDNTGKKVPNGKGHKKADKLKPSDDELRSAICEVLKEVDFNTATFTDILQILAKRYDTDLTPRKISVKNMIQDELTRLVDEADEEDEEENAEDEKQPSVQGVEA